MGTMDDLSDDEKTRAFLQLLEYKLRMEKEQVTGTYSTGWKTGLGSLVGNRPYQKAKSTLNQKEKSTYFQLANPAIKKSLKYSRNQSVELVRTQT